MADNDDLTTALLALGAIGLGIAGFAALGAQQKRRSFRQALESGLRDHRVELVNAELGRPGGDPVWYATVKLMSGVVSYEAAYKRGTDPYSVDTLNDLITRLVEAIRRDHGWSATA